MKISRWLVGIVLVVNIMLMLGCQDRPSKEEPRFGAEQNDTVQEIEGAGDWDRPAVAVGSEESEMDGDGGGSVEPEGAEGRDTDGERWRSVDAGDVEDTDAAEDRIRPADPAGLVEAGTAIGSDSTPLHKFLRSHEWDELVLISEGEDYAETTIPIEDPRLREMLIQKLTSLTEEETGSFFDLKDVYFLLRNGDEQIKLQVDNYGRVALPDWYGSRVFGVHGNLLTIVDSLLRRPDYMPEASLEERLWDAGMMYYQIEDIEGYMDLHFRLRMVARHFISAEKKPAEPPNDPGEIDYLLRLYAHGGTTEFVVYTDYEDMIKVVDNGEDSWYEMSPEILYSLRFNLFYAN